MNNDDEEEDDGWEEDDEAEDIVPPVNREVPPIINDAVDEWMGLGFRPVDENLGEEELQRSLYVTHLTSLALRVPLLFFFDILSHSFLLCFLLQLLGAESNAFSGYVVNLNESLVTIRPKAIGFQQALFSWNSECDVLWEHLAWSYYLPLLFANGLLFLGSLVLFFSYNSAIIRFWTYTLPLMGVCAMLYWSISLTAATPVEVMKDVGQSHWWFWWLFPFKIFAVSSSMIPPMTFGYLGKHLYFASRRFLFPQIMENLSWTVKCLIGAALLCPGLQIMCSRFYSTGSGPFTLDVYVVSGIFAPILLFECSVFAIVVFWEAVGYFKREAMELRDVWRAFGLAALVSRYWDRLRMPWLLRCYWISRMALFLLYIVVKLEMYKPSNAVHFSPQALRYLLARGCETWVAVIGMTSVVSVVGQWVGNASSNFLRPFTLDEEDGTPIEEEGSGGSLTGLLFLVLAAQTGLTELVPEKRLIKLYRNLWLLSMALLHFIQHLAHAVLVRISTTGYYPKRAHLKALGVCCFLIVVPIAYIVMAMSERESVYNPWVISVVLFAVEVVIKVLVTLLVYAILMYNLVRGMRDVDEVTYWVKGVGHGLELLFAILLLLNGIWILIFEQTGLLRMVMIGIHAYCNIFLAAQEGWQSIKRRWEASEKLRKLDTPSPEELQSGDREEVCSICYQDWSASSLSVKRTLCGHRFHESCLRKWLYVQDTCPMCHSPIINVLPAPPPPAQN